MDTQIPIGTGLAILGSKEILAKLLGPSADYIGQEIKNLIQKCNVNLNRIFSNALKFLGDKIEQKGQVSPKVLKGIINNGSFCEDYLATEYFGGVLASSRTTVSRDDRGVTFISLLSSLSTYQIRTHYIFYLILKKLFNGKSLNISLEGEKMRVYIPVGVWRQSMEFSENEDGGVILTHVMNGLDKIDLVDFWAYGKKEHLKKYFSEVEGTGIIFQPSLFGAELFLWAHGRSDLNPHEFLTNKFEVTPTINIPCGAKPTNQIK